MSRTLRLAMATGGEPIRRAHRRRAVRPRRLVLICDVSGSMQPYARELLRFVHAAVAARPKGQVEAFALGTRLTRLSRDLDTRDPHRAMAAISKTIKDQAGGTRLGAGLHRFNATYGAPGMARGATVVILSDGWDRGDQRLLTSEMERLHRLAHRVIWANPLRADPGYQPIARGMAAALPYVDEFVDGHCVASLENLAQVLAR